MAPRLARAAFALQRFAGARRLRACGYSVLTRSAAAGVDAFVKEERDGFAVRLLPGPSGIRRRYAVARISPRRRPLSPRRARALSGGAAGLFRRARRRRWRTTFARAPSATAAPALIADFPMSRARTRRLRTPGAAPPSASMKIGSYISRTAKRNGGRRWFRRHAAVATRDGSAACGRRSIAGPPDSSFRSS